MRHLKTALRGLGILTALTGVLTGFCILATWSYAELHRDPVPMPNAQAIVALSGPGAYPRPPVADTAQRVRRSVALWNAHKAPLVVMTGNGPYFGRHETPDSQGMRLLAEDLGMPPDAIIEEDRAYSTLQNGFYTAALPMIDPADPILLVTNRHHLARAWASFRWAGFSQVILVASDEDPRGGVRTYVGEGVKALLNAVRALAASGALALGMPEAQVIGWLE